MQGWRLNMEDACITNLEFDKDTALFGVFDGHGGKEASMVVKDNLERIIKSQDLYKDGKYEKALYEGF
jgi:serine/threonine protein phosphatase PrpC